MMKILLSMIDRITIPLRLMMVVFLGVVSTELLGQCANMGTDVLTDQETYGNAYMSIRYLSDMSTEFTGNTAPLGEELRATFGYQPFIPSPSSDYVTIYSVMVYRDNVALTDGTEEFYTIDNGPVKDINVKFLNTGAYKIVFDIEVKYDDPPNGLTGERFTLEKYICVEADSPVECVLEENNDCGTLQTGNSLTVENSDFSVAKGNGEEFYAGTEVVANQFDLLMDQTGQSPQFSVTSGSVSIQLKDDQGNVVSNNLPTLPGVYEVVYTFGLTYDTDPPTIAYTNQVVTTYICVKWDLPSVTTTRDDNCSPVTVTLSGGGTYHWGTSLETVDNTSASENPKVISSTSTHYIGVWENGAWEACLILPVIVETAPAIPTVTESNLETAVCQVTSVTYDVNSPQANETYYWFANQNDVEGQELGTGNQYVLSPIDRDKLWLEAKDNNTQCLSGKLEINTPQVEEDKLYVTEGLPSLQLHEDDTRDHYEFNVRTFYVDLIKGAQGTIVNQKYEIYRDGTLIEESDGYYFKEITVDQSGTKRIKIQFKEKGTYQIKYSADGDYIDLAGPHNVPYDLSVWKYVCVDEDPITECANENQTRCHADRTGAGTYHESGMGGNVELKTDINKTYYYVGEEMNAVISYVADIYELTSSSLSISNNSGTVNLPANASHSYNYLFAQPDLYTITASGVLTHMSGGSNINYSITITINVVYDVPCISDVSTGDNCDPHNVVLSLVDEDGTINDDIIYWNESINGFVTEYRDILPGEGTVLSNVEEATTVFVGIHDGAKWKGCIEYYVDIPVRPEPPVLTKNDPFCACEDNSGIEFKAVSSGGANEHVGWYENIGEGPNSTMMNGFSETLTLGDPPAQNFFTAVWDSQKECLSEKVEVEIDPVDCCISGFNPEPGQKYVISAWVKEGHEEWSAGYTGPQIHLDFVLSGQATKVIAANGPVVNGWQKLEAAFVIPANTTHLELQFVNTGSNEVYFDDVRVHPFNASMISYVYDMETMQLEAQLNDDNYATYFIYDESGALVKTKVETKDGIQMVNESRAHIAR